MFTKSARFYDAIYAWKDYRAEAETVTSFIRAAAPGASTLLDVACGTGAHLEHLRHDFVVEGIDLDPELLAVARKRLPDTAFHEGDMRDFDLGKTFDAVTCLFSSIGYMTGLDDLHRAIGAMARHLNPGGVLVVEGWLTPEVFEPGHLHALFVDEPDLKIARINDATGDVVVTEPDLNISGFNDVAIEGRLSRFTFHYLVGTPDDITSFTEEHVLGLFSRDEYEEAFRKAGLDVTYDGEGLMGRGNYIGVKR
jgi:SAM-dependent methyltransferase